MSQNVDAAKAHAKRQARAALTSYKLLKVCANTTTFFLFARHDDKRVTQDVTLRKAMNASQTLHSLLLKFVKVFMVQTAHSAIADARANVDKRVARWILMAHNRTRHETPENE
jgi:hypothetical protein